MHKAASGLQIGAVLVVVSLAIAVTVDPSRLRSSVFAEPGISVDQYIDRLSKGTSNWQKYNAAAALGELGDKRAIPHLTAALQSPHESVRENATVALGQLRATGSKAAVEKLLHDPSPAVQTNARAVLREWESQDKAPRLQQAAGILVIVGPAVVLIAALGVNMVLYPRLRARRLASVALWCAWPAGLFAAWLAQGTYSVSATRKIVGLPVVAAVLEFDGQNWVDYVSAATPAYLALDALYGFLVPQALAAVLFAALWLSSQRAASA